ncbi:MAG: dihydroorotase [Candidatus Marinimicrobia bacterium]|nr:dihydroorotase [Candidatus Neomarinimicrobiota bacterium]
MKVTQSNKSLLLKGGKIYDPVKGQYRNEDILIENGKIKTIGKVTETNTMDVRDCTDKIITHGFCDIHVHFREPGREDKESLATGAQAALAGGFTRVCAMPNTNPPLDTPESIRFIMEKQKDLPVHIHPIGAVTKQQGGKEMTEMASMKEEGAVAFSDDGLPIADGQVMRLALEYSTMMNVPVINHAEDLSLRGDGVMNEGKMSTRLGLPGNPDISESVMVHRDLELAKLTEAILHVPHVSSAKSVQLIRAMKATGAKVTAEVTPHHLYFNDTALENYDTNLKVAPPIRTEEDRLALVEGVKDGTLDCIATDHAPHTIEEKEGTFDTAPFGLIGLESSFGAVYTSLVKNAGVSLEQILDAMTIKPRQIMGFDTDLLMEGKEAELVVLDIKREWVFEKTHIYSRSANCPFVGEAFAGKPEMVLNGTTIVEISK